MPFPDVEFGQVRVTEHRGDDDLLSAGVGLRGLSGFVRTFADPSQPTPGELRRRAIQSSWKGIADLGPLGGYGQVYGAVPDVPGREYQSFARIAGANASHRVLLQLPDHFDRRKRCLVVTASSGSRGIYGAMALAGAWGLPRGCAVAYTDKGGGAGYFDYADDTGVALDGCRARRGDVELEFEPPASTTTAGVDIKHMHSGDNPEAHWGHHVIQAAQFGLAMLDRAYPADAPFTSQNTRIIATGLSNGGGAVLQAAGLDQENFFSGVIALEPNVFSPERGRALYDYATEAAIWLPCALVAERFADAPLVREPGGTTPADWIARCTSLRERGLIAGVKTSAQGEHAHEKLRDAGWTDAAMATAASSTVFDLWRVITAGYASSYLRSRAINMPCGFRYATVDARGVAAPVSSAMRAAWWADGSGIPPGHGIGLLGGRDESADPTLCGSEDLRRLWNGDATDARILHKAVAETAVQLPRKDLPLWIVHGASDGLLPAAFSSEPYVNWLRENGRQPLYWKIAHAQHFDAFLSLTGFGARHVPLLPYGYAALDQLWRHLHEHEAWPADMPTPPSHPRGHGALDRQALGLL
ncbi:3-hydroxybutyrate oligomer hydrolase family protein [Rhodanobacter sp. L36]|uniref:3-hydroxybutyrate oligomer hydrolase family protein n=1 Tax=Rhodanobacter sp. L36 TaxID=1747221 RepID=UPI00131EBDC1|nr:3-hydroxybutyrate oligomer hydrolase family protein [Rhodanobacter sp. L36]